MFEEFLMDFRFLLGAMGQCVWLLMVSNLRSRHRHSKRTETLRVPKKYEMHFIILTLKFTNSETKATGI